MFDLSKNTNGVVSRKAIIFATDTNSYFPKEILIELFSETRKGYTCPLHGKRLLKGLTETEERMCPAFIAEVGVSETSGEFTQAVKDYWNDFVYKVPFSTWVDNRADGSIEINGSYSIIDGKLYPVEINDFFVYNVMLLDNKVGKTMKSCNELSQYDFIMLDKLEKEKEDIVRVENGTKIIIKLAELYSMNNFQEVARQILLTSKQNSYEAILRMTDSECTTALTSFANSKSDKFLTITGSKNLSQAALIMELIAMDVLRLEDDIIFNDMDKIGTMNNAIAYLLDPKKSVEVSVLKEKLMEAKETTVFDETFS